MSEARGYKGVISFDGRAVTIIRGGFVDRMARGGSEKTIPISQISAVQWKPARRLMVYGFLEMTIAGAIETKAHSSGMKVQNVDNENAIVFVRTQQNAMQVVREEIQSAILNR